MNDESPAVPAKPAPSELHPVDQALADFAAALKAQLEKKQALAQLEIQAESARADLDKATADAQAKRQALDSACYR